MHGKGARLRVPSEPPSELRDRLSTGRLREGDTSSKARRATFTGPGKIPRARPRARIPTASGQGSHGLGPGFPRPLARAVAA